MDYAIKADGLSKSYGALHAVKNLSFAVPEGSVFGLLGANGAGKSTTIECVLGTRKRDGGTVSILGADPEKSRSSLFEKVGVQFQEAHYQDNIRVGELCDETASLYAVPADYRALLERFGLSDKLGSPVNELSGGQKQKLFIVLALIPDPRVVFLDELTTGLDAKARRDVWSTLKKLKADGLTVFLTSHFMDEVEALCDTICILKNGESVFYGTVVEAVKGSPFEKFEDAYLWYTGEEDEKDEGIR